MTKFEAATLLMSTGALFVSIIGAYFQYQSRRDSVEERLSIEMKTTFNGSVISPTDLRMISGVEERKGLRLAILATNTGSTVLRILEVGYQDDDQPKHAFYSAPSKAKVLAPGEQALFPIKEAFQIRNQLTSNIQFGEDGLGKVFAVTTKRRFSESATIVVAQ